MTETYDACADETSRHTDIMCVNHMHPIDCAANDPACAEATTSPLIPPIPSPIKVWVEETPKFTDPDTDELIDPETWLFIAETRDASDVAHRYQIETGKAGVAAHPQIIPVLLRDLLHLLIEQVEGQRP